MEVKRQIKIVLSKISIYQPAMISAKSQPLKHYLSRLRREDNFQPSQLLSSMTNSAKFQPVKPYFSSYCFLQPMRILYRRSLF